MDDSFVITADNTTGIVAQKAVTIGAGVQDGELFDTLLAQKAFAVGGANVVSQIWSLWSFDFSMIDIPPSSCAPFFFITFWRC